MAHSGRVYPVAFRRDFNLNVVTNNTGIAAGYNFATQGLSGSVGSFLNGHLWPCVAYDQSTYNGIKWKSPTLNLSGRHVVISFELGTMDGLSTTFASGRVTDSLLGDLGDFNFGVPTNQSYKQVPGRWVDFSWTNPSILAFPFSTQCNLVAVEWAQWNAL